MSSDCTMNTLRSVVKHRLAVSLGSNSFPLSSRLHHIELAASEIQSRIGPIVASSGLYETITAYVDNPLLPETWEPYYVAHNIDTSIEDPVTNIDIKNERIPPHLNAVLLLESSVNDPKQILVELQSIEKDLGRQRATNSIARNTFRSNDIERIKMIDTSEHSNIRETNPQFINFNGNFIEDQLEKDGNNSPYNPALREFQRIRSIDIDLLLFDEYRINDSDFLILPHPGLTQRNFILFPLRDVWPSASIPTEQQLLERTNATVQDYIDANLRSTTERFDALRSRPTQVFVVRPDLLWGFGPGFLPRIMGVLNVTPDSFSDGGIYNDVKSAVERARKMINEGVDIIDIGGESTAPGRVETPIAEELQRVIPVIKAIREFSDIPISIDTRKAKVLEACVVAGADILNDVSGGVCNPSVLSVAKRFNISIILGHTRGTPEDMHMRARYKDVVQEVATELTERVEAASKIGIPRWRIMVDVGLGFAKSGRHNLQLIRHLEDISNSIPSGVCQAIGFSRKKFISDLLNGQQCGSLPSGKSPVSLQSTNSKEVEQRDYACIALLTGLVKQQLDEIKRVKEPSFKNGQCLALVRTHRVKESVQACNVISTIFRTSP